MMYDVLCMRFLKYYYDVALCLPSEYKGETIKLCLHSCAHVCSHISYYITLIFYLIYTFVLRFKIITYYTDLYLVVYLTYYVKSTWTVLKQTPNATLWTMRNISFGFLTIATKLGICVYNHICNNMVPANKDNFQK